MSEPWTAEYVGSLLSSGQSVATAHNAAIAAEEKNGDEVCREWEKRYCELEQQLAAAVEVLKEFVEDYDNPLRDHSVALRGRAALAKIGGK